MGGVGGDGRGVKNEGTIELQCTCEARKGVHALKINRNDETQLGREEWRNGGRREREREEDKGRDGQAYRQRQIDRQTGGQREIDRDRQT